MAKVGPATSPIAHEARGVVQMHGCASGRQIEYTVQGRCAEGDPWLLHLHGMCMSNNVQPLPAHLSMGLIAVPPLKTQADWDSVPFRVILPARAGYGRSSPMPDVKTWTYRDMAADMADLCNALGASKVALIGASTGGPNCCAFAAFYPSRVSAILSISGDANYGPSQPCVKQFNLPWNAADPKYGVGMAMCRSG